MRIIARPGWDGNPNKGGTSEHPEELAYRCCLSALAGFSKYLPFFGANSYYTTSVSPGRWLGSVGKPDFPASLLEGRDLHAR